MEQDCRLRLIVCESGDQCLDGSELHYLPQQYEYAEGFCVACHHTCLECVAPFEDSCTKCASTPQQLIWGTQISNNERYAVSILYG